MTFTTIYQGLQQLHASFSPDGKRCSPDRWQDLLRLLHDDELPNDWRFQTTCALANTFLEFAQPDWSAEEFTWATTDVVDGLVDVYNGQLLSWVADIPSRAVFGAPEFWSFEDSADIIERVRARQFEAIEEMATHLIGYLDENLSS